MVTGSADAMMFLGARSVEPVRSGWVDREAGLDTVQDICPQLLGCSLVTIPTELSELPVVECSEWIFKWLQNSVFYIT